MIDSELMIQRFLQNYDSHQQNVSLYTYYLLTQMKVDKILNMSDAEVNKQLKINTKKVLNNLDKIPQTPKRFFIKKY